METNNITHEHPVVVHLGATESSAPQQIYSGELVCEKKKWLRRIIGIGNPYGKYRLELKITNTSGLKFNNKNQVLQIEVEGKKGNVVEFKVNKDTTSYNVLFDANQVIDGSTGNPLALEEDGNYKAGYQLEYVINAIDVDKKEQIRPILKGCLDVFLVLMREKALAYQVEFVTVGGGLDFTSQFAQDAPATEGDRWPQIAELHIRHASGLRCAPSTDVNFKIKASQNKSANVEQGHLLEFNNQQVCVGISAKSKQLLLKESHPVKPRANVGLSGDATALSLTNKHSQGYLLSGLYGYNDDKSEQNVITIPVHIDRNALKNPEDAEVLINVSVDHRLAKSASISTEELTIPLRKNTNLVELRAKATFLSLQGEMHSHDFREVPDLDVIALDRIPLSSQQEASATLTLRNAAETVEYGHEGAGIIITDFQLGGISSPNDLRGEIERIITHAGKGKGLDKIFSFNSELKNRPVVLHCKNQCNDNNGWVNEVEIKIKYSVRDILKIEPRKDNNGRYIYSSEVILPFSFKYLIDSDGQETEQCEKNVESYLRDVYNNMETCTGSLRIHLEKSLAPEWLCVDFGTSAVVALYGANGMNSRLLPINKHRKDFIIPNAYPQEATQRIDSSEASDDFLPTTVYLNPQNEGQYDECKEPFKISESAVWLSPTTGMVAGRIDYQLPSLKLMLGFDYLPDIFSHRVHDKFRYHSKNEDGESQLFSLKNPYTNDLTEICQVSNLIKIIYKQLINYYLRPSIDQIANQNKTQVQKIILTIPNTFTPDNVKMLREMISELVPDLHYDQIRFVSESDAVACYYLSNEEAFQAERRNGTEYLLVFDMGAGTLDLTYLKRERIITNQKKQQTITIEGKMGVSKAGNYMDYKIATIIQKLLQQKAINPETSSLPAIGQKEAEKNESKPHVTSNEKKPLATPSLNAPLLGGSIKDNKVNAPALGSGLGGGLDPVPLSSNHKANDIASKVINEPKTTRIGRVNSELISRVNNLLRLDLTDGQTQESMDNELKDYVRQQVKPMLSGDKDKQLPSIKIGIEYEVPITVKEILEHPDFKEYISETTSKVLDNFRKMFATDEGTLPVDTLIFSGRSTHLLDIRKGVMDYLTRAENNTEAEKCQFADMGSMSFIDRKTYQSQESKAISGRSDGLKTAVAKGALAYVTFFGSANSSTKMISRNIYANYGLLWNNADGWHYTELLSINTVPTVEAKTPTDGLYIDQYKIMQDFDFSHESVGRMMLIQTYSKDPAKDWLKNNHEMISVLVSIENCSDYSAHIGPYKIELEVDAANHFTFRIGGQEITVSPHVDFKDEALRRSIWPVIFSK